MVYNISYYLYPWVKFNIDYRVMALLCQLDNGQNRSLFCLNVKVPTLTNSLLKFAFRLRGHFGLTLIFRLTTKPNTKPTLQ